MHSGMLGHMANLPTNGVNGHVPGDALAAGRLPGTPESILRDLRFCTSSVLSTWGHYITPDVETVTQQPIIKFSEEKS
ncbi:hypothetical protein F7725_002565 [Dissostichus mawsoni]|uniref:Uncharacterized protein n=1 Tax=Dissostichus mawsoni TaxID=36200 RepID=A0A7J5Y2Q6_DISMA|nr:hypothetical protein F7725_002565 [Dissostichus mawsoni]